MKTQKLIALAGTVAALVLSSSHLVTRAAAVTIEGVVAGSSFTPPAGSAPSNTIASYYQQATVCVDANDNAACDAGEASATTDADGAFTIAAGSAGPLVAEVSTASTNAGQPIAQRVVLRAPVEDALASSPVAITPLSTEIARTMEWDQSDYATARQTLATRLGVPADAVVADPNTISDAAVRAAVLSESVILTNRFDLAAVMVDRHDMSPAALAADPSAIGPPIAMKEAYQTAMGLEGIPRYDHIFVIVLENRPSTQIKNNPFAPAINGYLNAGNQFISYNATGNPSEPNRVAIAAADDFGITDDNGWNCIPAGSPAPDDGLPAGLAACTQATNHNIRNRPNLMTALDAAGMKWRVYSESMNPGRDWRLNGASNTAITATDHVYPAGSPVGAIGNPSLQLTFASSLYATKHNESLNFQNVRSSAAYAGGNRTMGGGQWDTALGAIAPAGWDMDQLGTDLWNGGVGNLNYLEPDQCDDMHGATVTGKIGTTTVNANDCGSGTGGTNGLIYRSDRYTDWLIKKIQASPVWTNTSKRTAIVISFDEGSATTGLNSCCGWNPAGKPGYGTLGPLGPVVKDAGGVVSNDTTIANYSGGNKGHGASVFGVLTNQPNAPKGIVDSDAYSHFSFVRTLQDMFGVADPGDDWTYMNRSKYTESFIAANLLLLREFTGSPDPHFDAVRPMNHAYVIPASYTQKTGIVTPPGAQVGPDASQFNAWALRYEPPTTSATVSPAPNAAGWNNSDVTVGLTAAAIPGGPAVDHLTYGVAGAQSTATTALPGSTASFLVTAEGVSTATFFAADTFGNLEAPQAIGIAIDKTAPVVTGSVNPSANASGWINTLPVVVSFNCTDTLSGLAAPAPPPTTLTTEVTNQAVSATCGDVAGNSASLTISPINIDTTAPSVSASASPSALWLPNGKMVPVVLRGTMSDALSGIDPGTAQFVVSDEYGQVQPSGPVAIGADGSFSVTVMLEAARNGSDADGRTYTLTVSASDRAGNAQTASALVTVPHDAR